MGLDAQLIPMTVPRQLYRAEQVRELDRIAIEDRGVPGFMLMTRAAEAAFQLLLAKWPRAKSIAVMCGAGNNGGDAYVVAALARRHGLDVTAYMAAPADKLKGDALTAWQMAEEAGVPMRACDAAVDPGADVIVDGLLGTGLSGDVRPGYAALIDSINASGRPVLALDIPSGLCSDTGSILGTAIRANHTISFIGMKQGLLTGSGRACAGGLHYDDLQVPEGVLEALEPASERLDVADLAEHLPPRRQDAHKGGNGHVMIIGGGEGMGGAVAMAARAALRTGAGLVSVATWPAHVPGIIAQAPEVMVHGVSSGQELEPLLEHANVLVVGPGLGQTPWSEQLLQKAAATGKAMVLDADALNIVAAQRVVREFPRANWLLTPHPGEASRLLGCDTASIQRDRFAAVAELQARYGGTVILKGSGTLVTSGNTISLCPYGNPGMATAGMGDVLSGICGALLAQGIALQQAASVAVSIHGRAADMAAAEGGQRGLQATDLLPWVRRLVNP